MCTCCHCFSAALICIQTCLACLGHHLGCLPCKRSLSFLQCLLHCSGLPSQSPVYARHLTSILDSEYERPRVAILTLTAFSGSLAVLLTSFSALVRICTPARRVLTRCDRTVATPLLHRSQELHTCRCWSLARLVANVGLRRDPACWLEAKREQVLGTDCMVATVVECI